MNKSTRDFVVYVLVRTDLPSMNPGKAMAQVHHAGVQMMSKYSRSAPVRQYISEGLKQAAEHFNTTLVLGATVADIKTAYAAMKKLPNSEYGMVWDPSYPFIVENDEIAGMIHSSVYVNRFPDGKVLMTRKELTCAWFLGDRNDPEFKNLFEGLKLHE